MTATLRAPDPVGTAPVATAPVATAPVAPWRSGWTALVVSSLSRVVLGALALLLAVSVLPALVGWQSSVVLSGSMAPTFSPGDVAVVRPVSPAELRPGQVLLVDDPDSPGTLRLHRLVDVQAGGLQLRGDANPAPDGTLVDPAAVHGVVALGLPLLGRPVVWLAEGRVWPLLGTGVGLLALIALAGAHRRPDDDLPPPSGAADPREPAQPRARRRLPGRALRRGTVLTAAVLVTVSLPGATAVFSDTTASPALGFPVAALWTCPDVGAASGAAFYHRLQESSGAIAGNSGTAGAAGNATYSSTGVSRRAPGPTCGGGEDRAVTLDGATGYLWTTQAVANPQTFTVQLWFNTSTTRGGKLIGFGNGTNGDRSSQYDRHVYMTTTGQLAFGVFSGVYSVLTTPAAYNDGRWHLVTASLSAGGMRLSVDGTQVAANPAVTTAETFTGYWRIGYDNLGNWPSAPTSYYFAGSIAHASVYSTALSTTQVRQAYDISR